MYEFDCHYRKERWQTAKYFDLVKEFLIAAQNGDNSDDCEPPPCPTSPRPVTTEEYLTGKYERLLGWAKWICLIRTCTNGVGCLEGVAGGLVLPLWLHLEASP